MFKLLYSVDYEKEICGLFKRLFGALLSPSIEMWLIAC